MTTSTNTDATFTDAWCNRMVAKYWRCQSTPPADKEINGAFIFQATISRTPFG